MNQAGFAISSKERPSFAITGYARQNPWVPRKSGKPESTPMPAPAVTSRASAALMASAASLTFASVLASTSALSAALLVFLAAAAGAWVVAANLRLTDERLRGLVTGGRGRG